MPHQTAQRFNEIGDPPVQYLALHPLVPWAEQLRANDYRTVRLAEEMRMRIWVLRVSVDRYLELSFDIVASDSSLGLQPHDLISDNFGPCQEFAQRLLSDAASPRALVVPSAALPGTQNLVVFGERLETDYLDAPIDAVIDVPTSLVAEAGQSPLTLLSLVRFRDEPHAERRLGAEVNVLNSSNLSRLNYRHPRDRAHVENVAHR